MVAVIVGLFSLAGLAYLQYHQIDNINWNKLQTVSEGAITILSDVLYRFQVLVVEVVAMAMRLLRQLPH
jgi:uncharacterized membrane protein (Fun14 family)